jgi:hypothetical protein
MSDRNTGRAVGVLGIDSETLTPVKISEIEADVFRERF